MVGRQARALAGRFVIHYWGGVYGNRAGNVCLLDHRLPHLRSPAPGVNCIFHGRGGGVLHSSIEKACSYQQPAAYPGIGKRQQRSYGICSYPAVSWAGAEPGQRSPFGVAVFLYANGDRSFRRIWIWEDQQVCYQPYPAGL